jgi:hypothetical protein
VIAERPSAMREVSNAESAVGVATSNCASTRGRLVRKTGVGIRR